MDAKKATLRPLPQNPTPVVRLVTTAEYTRTIRAGTGNEVPLNSTYRQTLCDPASNKEEMYNRCIQARKEGSRRDMVRAAARALPLDIIDRVTEETVRVQQEQMQATSSAATQLTQSAAAREIAYVTPAIETFSKTLASEPRHPSTHLLISSFFTTGSASGPFPGQKSEQGETAAGAYWVDRSREGNTAMIMGKGASKYASGGYRLLNHNHL